MTAILSAFVIGAIWGLVTGLRLKHRRFLTVREQLRDATQRISAWKLADTKGDLDVVGSVTGPTKTVELFDGAQLAEWREQAERPRDIYSFLPAGDDCPEAGGCRRQCETGCYWRRLDDLNRGLADDDPASFPRSLPDGRERR